MSDFDVVIVGAGCAGLTAAYKLANAGKSVLVVERGNFAGAKNMTGGRIYGHALAKVWPDYADSAPLERKITHERISMMTADGNMTLDYTSSALSNNGAESYSVLRSTFDQWLAEQAEGAGAELIFGIRVDSLMIRDGQVCGIVAGEDQIEADVTIIAEGVNSLLPQQLGYLKTPEPQQLAVGVKALYQLEEQIISDRFQCASGEGSAWLFVGDVTKGRTGGGFLYTNKSSVSVGLVATLSDLVQGTTPVYQMLEDFISHEALRPVLNGAKLIEYSGHLIPEGGYNMLPKLAGNGVLIVGDAAMLCMNLGYAVRGMDLAVTSGDLAAQAVLEASSRSDYSETSLSSYVKLLNDSYVLQDLKRFAGFPNFMETNGRLFNEYPALCRDIFTGLFRVDGTPTQPLKPKIMSAVKKVGIMNIARDVIKGGKVL
jgi:electron transfer flavoprotein-quinone oxidoreductase